MLGNLAAFENPDSQIVVVILNDKRETLCAGIWCLAILSGWNWNDGLLSFLALVMEIFFAYFQPYSRHVIIAS